MATTLNKQPALLSFIGNPMMAQFTSGYAAQNGVVQIDCTGGLPSSSETFTIVTDVETIIFKTGTYAAVADFVTAIEADYRIQNLFTVSEASSVISLTTREKVDLNLSASELMTNATISVTTLGGRSTTNFCLCAVDVYDGSNYVPSGFDKELEFDEDGNADFDIRTAFDLEYDTINSLAAFTPFQSSNGLAQYKIRFSERTEANYAAFEVNNNPLFAILGKWSNDFIGTEINNQQWQTIQARSQTISESQPMFLTFAADLTPTAASLKIDAYEADGTKTTISKTITVPNKGEVWHYPVGYNQLSLETEANAPFSYYDVYLHHDSTETEKMRFPVDRETRANEAIFIFWNSRGGVDSVRLFGETEFVTEHLGDTIEREQSDGTLKTELTNARLMYRYKQYSGFFDDFDRFNNLDELLNSEKVFWYKNGTLKEVVIVARPNIEKGSDFKNLWELEFEFMSAFDANAPEVTAISSVALGGSALNGDASTSASA